MSQLSTVFSNFVAAIVAGTAKASDITGASGCDLTCEAKQALLNLLAERDAARLDTTKLVMEFKGEIDGNSVEVPNFLYGEIHTVDLNNSAQIDHAGTTQYVTDSDNDRIVEAGASYTWHPIPGKHHKARTFTVPAGVKIRYLFVLA